MRTPLICTALPRMVRRPSRRFKCPSRGPSPCPCRRGPCRRGPCRRGPCLRGSCRRCTCRGQGRGNGSRRRTHRTRLAAHSIEGHDTMVYAIERQARQVQSTNWRVEARGPSTVCGSDATMVIAVYCSSRVRESSELVYAVGYAVGEERGGRDKRKRCTVCPDSVSETAQGTRLT